jgi:type 1 glutamine amidotransferase
VAILIFSKTTDYRHESLPVAIAAVSELARAQWLAVEATEDAAVFSTATLSRFRGVVWLSTSGQVLGAEQRSAFQSFIESGGAYVGIHAASATESDWPWYVWLVGARFTGHPELQPARLRVEDRNHPATAHLPDPWLRADEWYEFDRNPRERVRVLVSVEESSYRGGGMGGDHPLVWCHEQAGGRAFYTALGHKSEYYTEPLLLAHLLGGLRMAAGVARFNCGRED